MNNHKSTPIQGWIDETAQVYKEAGGTSYAYQTGCLAMLKYIGLQNIEDPKKWVEELQQNYEIECRNRGVYEVEILKLQAETERLKEALQNIRNYESPTHPDYNPVAKLKRIAGLALKCSKATSCPIDEDLTKSTDIKTSGTITDKEAEIFNLGA